MDYNSATEQKILAAATTVFLEKGRDGARMQEIADLAGINKALLHYYFRSKNKLFEEVFKREMQTVIGNILDAISQTGDYRAFLQRFVRIYLHNIAPRRKLMRFILWEGQKDEPKFAEYFLEMIKKHGFKKNPVLLQTEKAVKSGQIRALDPVNLVLSLLGMCVFPFIANPLIRIILDDVDLKNPQVLENRIESIIDVLWNGIKPVEK